jgi:hypothetical protein
MTNVKLLVIVTNDFLRHRLLRSWHPFIVRCGPSVSQSAQEDESCNGPVAFGRVDVRDGLSLCVFIVDGGWRREYVCRVLAGQVYGYCLVVGPESSDLALGQDLLDLLQQACPGGGVVAVSTPEDADLVRAALNLPPDAAVASVDCDSPADVNQLLCSLLEHLTAVPAA